MRKETQQPKVCAYCKWYMMALQKRAGQPALGFSNN